LEEAVLVPQRFEGLSDREAVDATYRATRPKVERKIAHVARRRYGGRPARMRGTERLPGIAGPVAGPPKAP
jgi:hypothetical protein